MLYSCMSLNKLIAVMNYHPRTQARVVISLQSGRNYFCACESFGGKTTILLSPAHSPHSFLASPLLLPIITLLALNPISQADYLVKYFYNTKCWFHDLEYSALELSKQSERNSKLQQGRTMRL